MEPSRNAGTWFDGTEPVYDVDGEFVANRATLYNDDRWQMVDPEAGEITVFAGW